MFNFSSIIRILQGRFKKIFIIFVCFRSPPPYINRGDIFWLNCVHWLWKQILHMLKGNVEKKTSFGFKRSGTLSTVTETNTSNLSNTNVLVVFNLFYKCFLKQTLYKTLWIIKIISNNVLYFFRIEFSARKWTWVSIQLILYFVKNHTKQIFYPRQKIKLDRLGILTKRDVKYFKKSNFWIVSL